MEEYTTSFLVYRAYLKILVFPFYKAQFGCFPSHVQIPRCIKSLHASIKRKLTNECNLCMHACIAINALVNILFEENKSINWVLFLGVVEKSSTSTATVRVRTPPSHNV